MEAGRLAFKQVKTLTASLALTKPPETFSLDLQNSQNLLYLLVTTICPVLLLWPATLACRWFEQNECKNLQVLPSPTSFPL